ncbi:MAG: hypothetical protein R3264_12625, partial [Anaerolineae bacterium]|nr:hypothetical protein [Anaerolineae bacterium]
DVLGDHTQQGRIALPISGGLDSRTTVAVLSSVDGASPAQDHLWPYTYGYTNDSVETRIARQVASARKLPIHTFTVRPYLFDQLDVVLASVEGFQDVTQARQATIIDELAGSSDYLIAAHWGDVWLDDMGLVNPQTHDRPLSETDILQHALHKMEKRGHEWLVEHLCQPQLRRSNADSLLQEMVRTELAKVQHLDDPDFQVKAYKTDQWSFRWTTASLRMFQPGALPRLPFYDNRIADFFCTVPSEFVAGRQLQIDYLKRYAPDLARITWQAYDANLYNYQYFNSRLLPKRAFKKLRRTITRRPVIQRNWEVQFLNENGRQALRRRLLAPHLALHEFVSPLTLQTLYEDFYEAPSAHNGYVVSMLLTFSAWLEKYG